MGRKPKDPVNFNELKAEFKTAVKEQESSVANIATPQMEKPKLVTAIVPTTPVTAPVTAPVNTFKNVEPPLEYYWKDRGLADNLCETGKYRISDIRSIPGAVHGMHKLIKIVKV